MLRISSRTRSPNFNSNISDGNPLTKCNNDSVTTALVHYKKDSASDVSVKDSKPCAKPVVKGSDFSIIGSKPYHKPVPDYKLDPNHPDFGSLLD